MKSQCNTNNFIIPLTPEVLQTEDVEQDTCEGCCVRL